MVQENILNILRFFVGHSDILLFLIAVVVYRCGGRGTADGTRSV
jgi:hypothetical protein